MQTKNSYRNYINPFPPRYSEKAQREALPPEGEEYVEDKTGEQWDAVVRSLRGVRIVAVKRLFLVAPVKGGPTKRRKIMAERIAAVKNRKSAILETDTGRRTDNKADCAPMIVDACEDVGNSGRGRPGKPKKGRPPGEWKPHELIAMEAAWFDGRYKNDAERQTAIEKRTGKRPGLTWLRGKFGSPHKVADES